MAHELVFREGQALMIYTAKLNGAGLPWHGYGKPYIVPPTLEEVTTECGFDRTISLEDMRTDKGFLIPDRKAVIDSENRYLGTVGPEYRVLQDKDFVEALRPWVEGGFASVETAGLLAGGSRVWVQLKIKEGEMEVIPGDSIQSYIFAAQGHDGSLSVVSGYTAERIICRNTLAVALKEDGLIRVKHRGDVVQKSVDLQTKVFGIKAAAEKQVEMFRFLASKKVDVKGVDAFIMAVLGKDDRRTGGPSDRIRTRFMSGIGNSGQSYWHLLNAVTEDASHNLGNSMRSDAPGDREGRALSRLWFGSASRTLEKATMAAVTLAQGKELQVAA